MNCEMLSDNIHNFQLLTACNFVEKFVHYVPWFVRVATQVGRYLNACTAAEVCTKLSAFYYR